jgi:serine protease AprX
VQNKSAYNLEAINLSLGHPVAESYTTDPLCAAVRRAVKAGMVVVCAASNLCWEASRARSLG